MGDEDEPSAAPSLAAASDTLSAPRKFVAPAEFDSNTLSKLCKLKQGKDEGWTCCVCHETQRNNARLPGHILDRHAKVPGLLAILREHVEAHSRGMNKVTLREALAKATGEQTESAKRQKSCLEEMLAFKAADDMLKAYAYAVIDGNLPYSICEDDWPFHFINFGIKYGFHASQSKARKSSGSLAEASEYPSVEGYTITRAKLTKAVDDICTKTLKESSSDFASDPRS